MKVFTASAVAIVVLFMSACVWDGTPGDTLSFDYNLRGTWVSNDPGIYSGALVIEYDRITITDYSESQTPSGGNDSSRPFKGFTKGIPLKGYSEEGKLFITDGGLLQEGIPYTYWDDSPPPEYGKIKFLRFTFGDRVETLESR